MLRVINFSKGLISILRKLVSDITFNLISVAWIIEEFKDLICENGNIFLHGVKHPGQSGNTDFKPTLN